MTEDGKERIAKWLARAGVCSRRDAERLIGEGRVQVDGAVLATPAFLVTGAEDIRVDGESVAAPGETRLFLYHKPAGLVTTARDERGRATVFDDLPSDMPRVVSVGRLDLNTEGLLLLTNDGGLSRYLELPATGWIRRYRVRVHGHPDDDFADRLAAGLTYDGVHYGPIEAAVDRSQGTNSWLTLGLREGKNREIRYVMEACGLTVTRLIRVAYGPFQLGKLEPGAVKEVGRKVMHEQLAGYFGQKKS